MKKDSNLNTSNPELQNKNLLSPDTNGKTLPASEPEIITRLQDLELKNKELIQAHNQIRKLNECFLKFGSDPLENINFLVSVCGDLLGATCAIYNRKIGEMLCSLATWNTPNNFSTYTNSNGHICNDVINSTSQETLIFRELQNSTYAKTDPNVRLYGLKTYIGKAVKLDNINIGSLCVVFQMDFIPTANDLLLMEIVASAIGIEENRREVRDTLAQQNDSLSKLNQFATELAMFFSLDTLEEFILKNIKELAGAKAAVFTIYNPENSTLTAKHIEFESDLLNKLISMLGQPIKGYVSPVSIESYNEITKEIIGNRKTLYEVTFGTISRPVTDAIQTMFRIDHFIGIAYIVEGQLYGTSILAMGVGQPDPPKQLLDYFVFAASAALRRKKAEEKLLKSEKKFRFLTENSADVIFQLNKDYQIEYISPSCEYLLGYKPEEIIGKSIVKAVNQESLGLYLSQFVSNKQINLTNNLSEPYSYELHQKKKDGSYIWVEIFLKGFYNEKEELSGIHGIARNISKRKIALELLKKTEEQQRFILESLPVAIYSSPVNPDIDLTWINGNVKKITGFEIDEFLATNDFWRKRIHPEDNDRVLEEYRNLPKNKEAVIEYRWKCKDNQYHWFLDRTILIENDNQNEYLGVLIDITDRKNAEQELIIAKESVELSEKRFRTIIQSQSEGICFLNESEVFEFTNTAAENIFETDPNKLLGYSLFDFILEEEREKFFLQKEQKKNENVSEFEIQILTLKDNFKYLHFSNTKKYDILGCFLGNYSVIRDITERKQFEILLAQTHQNYESFFNSIDDFLFVLDLSGNIIYTNSTVIDRLGFTKEELIGSSVLNVHPPERREEAGRIVMEMLQGKAEFCPVPIVTKSGLQIPVETKVINGFWDGKPVLFGVTKDISKLQLSEEKFSKLFLLNPSACGLTDLETHKYIEVNDAFYTLFGFEKSEVIGKTPYELNIFTTSVANSILAKADKFGGIHEVEAELKTKNGDIKHVLLSSENIYVQNKKYRYTSVRDITDRKKFEREITLKNSELQKLNTDKDRFISILGHDLKSPFNNLVGISELLLENIRKYDIDKIEKFTGLINQSARNTYNLLEDILTWAQSQSGKIPFVPEIINCHLICESIVNILQPIADSKKVKIVNGLSKNSQIYADSNMLQTILRNLISNSIKYTMPGGEISISQKFSETECTISVIDNGVGISPILKQKLFDITHINSTRGTADEGGTGLGLLICKDFIDKHKGKISVESELGKGSTFSFSLPKRVE